MDNTSASVDVIASTASSTTSAVDQQTPNAVHTFSVVANLILGIIGLMGNTIVVLTVRKTRSFHDITHYLIVSLAMSDFLCCLFFIFSILFVIEGRPIQVDIPQSFFGEIFCRLFWSLHLFWSSFFASAFNLVVVTFERYFAIVHPMTYARSFTEKRGLMLAVSAWSLGFLLEIEFPIRFFVNDSGECDFPGLGPVWFAKLMFLKSFVVSFVAPLIFLVWAYYKILKTIRQGAANPERQGEMRAELRVASRRVVQCLLIITTLFILFLLPSELGNVLLFFDVPVDARLGFWEVFRTLTVMNSVVNPMIYAIKMKKFRRAMKTTLCPCVKTQLIQPEDTTDTNGIRVNTIASTTAP
ncbi:somatostatin receptor type 5-like [Patiria miniata]|uniref:G-protein coupled receptors family 1 profile domain-containing protein n=1 Tax=Patiria miniata TaxID=46514 RepID=A0A913ZLX9_PATMI|nr:somatostatin receptor type 5-like [Patiria miniata]